MDGLAIFESEKTWSYRWKLKIRLSWSIPTYWIDGVQKNVHWVVFQLCEVLFTPANIECNLVRLKQLTGKQLPQ